MSQTYQVHIGPYEGAPEETPAPAVASVVVNGIEMERVLFDGSETASKVTYELTIPDDE